MVFAILLSDIHFTQPSTSPFCCQSVVKHLQHFTICWHYVSFINSICAPRAIALQHLQGALPPLWEPLVYGFLIVANKCKHKTRNLSSLYYLVPNPPEWTGSSAHPERVLESPGCFRGTAQEQLIQRNRHSQAQRWGRAAAAPYPKASIPHRL